MEQKSNLWHHAVRELDVLCKTYPDPENQPIIKEFIPEILALVNKFGKSGQSGGSAPYVSTAISQAIKKLCSWQPLCDITGEPWEFENDPHHGGGSLSQNKRDGRIFKEPDGRFKFLDAILWKNQNGSTWTGSAQLPDGTIIHNQAYIKSFPFKPKTFTIDVIEEEVVKDGWEFHIKDPSQLEEVWKYYDKIVLEPKV